MDDETEHGIWLCALELEKKRYNPVHVSRPFGYAGRLLLVVFLSASQAHLAQADDGELARVQAHLYSGKLSEARKSAEAWVQAQPANQTAKFAFASTGFFQAVEKLGQDFHKYGLRSVWTDPSGGMSGVPFLRLPVPQNLNPERASYEAIRTVLSEFNSRLQTVDAELSGIELNDSIDYPLDLKQVRLDFKGGGNQEGLEPLWLVFQRITAMRPPEGESPNLIVNFDAADVVWLRGYTHLLSAITDFLLAHDWHKGFETALHNIFPRSNPEFLRLLTKQRNRADFELGGIADLVAFVHLANWPVVEPERMRSCLRHLETMVALSRKNWELILAETDDRNEWVPNPRQTPALGGLRVPEERVKAWQGFLDEFDALLQGKKLIPHYRFDKGINLRRFFLEPTAFDPILLIQGSAAVPYLENGEMTSPETWRQIMELFDGNFFTYFIWFN